jgi:hypothetical protein
VRGLDRSTSWLRSVLEVFAWILDSAYFVLGRFTILMKRKLLGRFLNCGSTALHLLKLIAGIQVVAKYAEYDVLIGLDQKDGLRP